VALVLSVVVKSGSGKLPNRGTQSDFRVLESTSTSNRHYVTLQTERIAFCGCVENHVRQPLDDFRKDQS
jgi:hypothetical protein